MYTLLGLIISQGTTAGINMVARLVLSVLGISGILGVGARPVLRQNKQIHEQDFQKIVEHISTPLRESKVIYTFIHQIHDLVIFR